MYRDMVDRLATRIDLLPDEATDDEWDAFADLMELQDEIAGTIASHIGGPPVPLALVAKWEEALGANSKRWETNWSDRVETLRQVLEDLKR